MNDALAFVKPTEPQETTECNLSMSQMEMWLQVAAAFGHGAGGMRISRKAMGALYAHYLPALNPRLEAAWDQAAVQALERVVASGRLAAIKATLAGRTSIAPEDMEEASRSVEIASKTALCPPAS